MRPNQEAKTITRAAMRAAGLLSHTRKNGWNDKYFIASFIITGGDFDMGYMERKYNVMRLCQPIRKPSFYRNIWKYQCRKKITNFRTLLSCELKMQVAQLQ